MLQSKRIVLVRTETFYQTSENGAERAALRRRKSAVDHMDRAAAVALRSPRRSLRLLRSRSLLYLRAFCLSFAYDGLHSEIGLMIPLARQLSVESGNVMSEPFRRQSDEINFSNLKGVCAGISNATLSGFGYNCNRTFGLAGIMIKRVAGRDLETRFGTPREFSFCMPLLLVVCVMCSNIWTSAQTIKVTLLGTGSPPPVMNRFGPSILVEAGDQKLIFDVGRGALQRLTTA